VIGCILALRQIDEDPVVPALDLAQLVANGGEEVGVGIKDGAVRSEGNYGL
jgi:hypothetical protein